MAPSAFFKICSASYSSTMSTTGLSTPAAGRNSADESRRSSRRSRGGDDPTPRKISVPKRYFTWRYEHSQDLNCFKFGLDPTIDAHHRVICDGCLFALSKTTNGILTDDLINKPRGNKNKICERPWDLDWKVHPDGGKVQRHYNFVNMFTTESVDEPVDATTVTPESPIRSPPRKKKKKNKKNKKKKKQQKQTTEEETEAGLPPPRLLYSSFVPPLSCFNDEGHFTDDFVKTLEDKIKTSLDSKTLPDDNDKRVAGMVLQWIFDEHDENIVPVANLPSFKSARKLRVAKMPGTYDVKETARNKRARTKKVSEWMQALESGGFNTEEEMFELLLQRRKNPIPKKYIIKAWNQQFRFDVETTLAMVKFADMNLKQLERLALFVDIETREPGVISKGLRFAAVTKECYQFKHQRVDELFLSMKYKRVQLLLSEKSKKRKVVRSTNQSVGSLRPLEVIANNIISNRANKVFVPAARRYNVKVWSGGETALYKFSADGGGGSNKTTVNPVNVDNPQGQQHVYPILEFQSKESYENYYRVLKAHPEVKEDMEDVINRRVILVEVKIGDQIGSCMVINSSSNHDYKTPKQLPDLSQELPLDVLRSSSQRSQADKRSLQDYAIKIDVDDIVKTKLVYNNTTKCYDGLVFQDADGNEVGTSYFKTPVISPTSQHECKMNQVLLLGVLSSDLSLLCTLFGHQGASATWFCLYCLMKQEQAKNAFAGTVETMTPRTLESLIADARKFEDELNKGTERDKESNKFRRTITQTQTHSVINHPLLNIPLECVSCATMHVVMGFTKWLVDLTLSGYEKIEQKAAATADGQNQVAFKEKIELQLKKARRYKEFLTEQLEDTATAVAVVAREQEIFSDIAARTEELEGIEDRLESEFGLSPNEIKALEDREEQLKAEREQLRGRLQSNVDANAVDVNDTVDHAQMLLESLCITNETIDELEHYAKNHVSHSTRVTRAVMKENGVDQTTYFNGSLVGNHCMIFAKKGERIYEGIFKEFEPVIQDAELKRELRDFTDRMKEIVALWYKIQRVIKSVERQSSEKIEQFEKDTNKLAELIFKLCKTDCPIKDWKPRLTRSLKAHLLFGGHLLKQLLLWGTLGGIDEQNIESAHAIWNKLLRQFGATRGKELQKKVLCEYLFQTSDVMHLKISHVKEEGKRNLKSRDDDASAQPRVTAARRRNVNEECQTEEVLDSDSLELGELATNINNEVALHQELQLVGDQPVDEQVSPEKVMSDDTMIYKCNCCQKLRLKLAFHIHRYESHQISTEIDGGDGHGET